MKVTRAWVAEKVAGKGYEPLQIDGIPEGFAFHATQDRLIGGVRDLGHLVAYIPLKFYEQNCVVYVPIVVAPHASDYMIETAKEDAKEQLLKLFKEYK